MTAALIVIDVQQGLCEGDEACVDAQATIEKVATAYADLKALEETHHARLIRKPFQEEELARRLHEAFAEFDDPKIVRLRGAG